MGKILITGVSGLIGGALAASLADRHAVIGMSRKKPAVDIPWIRGAFWSFEDLRALDDCRIEAVVHLAAVTGGCAERDGMLVNVEGTRCLTRYLMDRGCRKFVMASSIAVVGLQSIHFRPAQLPMPDEHPCLDRDGYGVSKYLMEEVMKYHVRQAPEIDVMALRLAAIRPDEKPAPLCGVVPLRPWGPAALTQMLLSDAVRAFSSALEAPRKPGLRILNAVGPKAWTKVPVADILRHWYGDEVDLSHYENPGREFDGLFACERIRRETGFTAQKIPDQPDRAE